MTPTSNRLSLALKIELRQFHIVSALQRRAELTQRVPGGGDAAHLIAICCLVGA